MTPSAARPARSVNVPWVERYMSWPVPIVLMEAVAEASLADRLARRRLGTAMAAMIRIIATTISNSIRENPFRIVPSRPAVPRSLFFV